MVPFDDSVFGRPLDAEVRAKEEKPVKQTWLRKQYERVKCLLTGST